MNVSRWFGISLFLIGAACLFGTSNFSSPQALAGKADAAKKVDVAAEPSKTTVKPGENKAIEVTLKRGADAKKEVTLTVEVEPKDKGVTVEIDTAKVAADKSAAKVTVKTTDKADGDYKVIVKSKSEGSDDGAATVALTVAKEAVVEKGGKGETIAFKAFEKTGQKFYTLQTTKTTQTMTVMSQTVVQKQEQSFMIEWTVKSPEGDNWVVGQKIVGVWMDIDIGGNKIGYKSTDLAKAKNPMTDFFDQLMKDELTYYIKKDLSKVEKVEGRDKFIKGLQEINPQMQNLLKAILSEKSLQKMAEPAWFAFPTNGVIPADKKWNRSSDLDLGPIGKYETKFDFTLKGTTADVDTIDIKSDLKYTAPTDKAGLPFIIHKADLTTTGGTGAAKFDRTKGRFQEITMDMNLKGTLDIEVGSMKTTVKLEQTQNAKTTTLDDLPAEWKAAPK